MEKGECLWEEGERKLEVGETSWEVEVKHLEGEETNLAALQQAEEVNPKVEAHSLELEEGTTREAWPLALA